MNRNVGDALNRASAVADQPAKATARVSVS